MNAITLLKNDHKTVEDLFKRFEKLGPRAVKSKQDVVERIIRELSIHAGIEEMFFYPAIREAADGGKAGDMVLESLEEHHIVKWTLSELEKMKPDEERYEPKMTVLMENVKHHVEEEEEELFPKVRKLLNAKMLEELGDRMQKAKKLAPTRPHPRASDTPPGNMVSGTIAAMLDKGKDLVRGMLEQ